MTKTQSRVALVTGATSGIGEATVRKLLEDGMRVVGNGRTAEKLKSLECELGPNFVGVVGDASDPKVVQALFDTALTQFQQNADLIVANAGRGLGGSVKDADLSEFDELLKLNVTGTLVLLQKAARLLADKQENSFPKTAADIVIIGSVVGRHISPFSAVYGSTKFAVHALAEGLRREVGPLGVRVTLVEPGVVVSGFQSVAGYSDAMVDDFHERFGPLLYGSDIADAIAHIVNLPPHVHISDIVVRPTRQDYP